MPPLSYGVCVNTFTLIFTLFGKNEKKFSRVDNVHGEAVRLLFYNLRFKSSFVFRNLLAKFKRRLFSKSCLSSISNTTKIPLA